MRDGLFHHRLRFLRKHRGMTQRELALKVEVVESTICLYETGRREPTVSTLVRIADALQVSVDGLLGRAAA